MTAIDTTTATPAPVEARVDELFARWDRDDTPGCAVGVVRDGELILERYYGMADLEHSVAIGPGTVFDIASTSKQFTAAAILLLAREGALDLDDPIQSYVPEIPEYAEPITVRHLVHHTSGIRDHLALRHLAGVRGTDHHDMQDSLDYIARQRGLNFPPGSKHMYSNSGYVLLAIIVSRVTGVSLDEFCRQRIFEPLGMQDTHFREDMTEIVPGMVQNYLRTPKDELRKSYDNDDIVGDGALLTTLRDLAKWDRNFLDETVGGPGFTEQMSTPGTPPEDPERYAFGLQEREHRGLRTVSHGGNLYGYSGDFVRFPDQRLTVMCLANYGGFDSPGLARAVAELYLGDLMTPPAADATGGTAPADASDASEPAGDQPDPSTLVGSYRETETGLLFDIDADAGGLVVRVDEFRIPLRDQRGLTFKGTHQDITIDVTFELSDDGEPKQVRFVYQDEPLFTADAIAPPENLDLAEYAGDYCSDEVASTWCLTVEDGALTARRGRTKREVVRPSLIDEFSLPFGGIRFVRDEAGVITGFVAATSRASGVEFARNP